MVTTLSFNAYLHNRAGYHLQDFQVYPKAEESERYMERDCRERSTITTRRFFFFWFLLEKKKNKPKYRPRPK